MTDFDIQPPPPKAEAGGPRSTNLPLLAVAGLAALALVAAVTFAVLWAGARSDLVAATDEVEQLRAEAADRQAEVDARPDVGAVAERWLGDTSAIVTGSAQSATVRLQNVDDATREGLDGLLDDLGFSSAVRERMARTRALDGTQDASGHNVNVTWTYHPDTGLQMVFEVER